jgi:hypothetical protein
MKQYNLKPPKNSWKFSLWLKCPKFFTFKQKNKLLAERIKKWDTHFKNFHNKSPPKALKPA